MLHGLFNAHRMLDLRQLCGMIHLYGICELTDVTSSPAIRFPSYATSASHDTSAQHSLTFRSDGIRSASSPSPPSNRIPHIRPEPVKNMCIRSGQADSSWTDASRKATSLPGTYPDQLLVTQLSTLTRSQPEGHSPD